MDPNFDKPTGLSLPQPVEGVPPMPGTNETAPEAAEAAPVAGERIAGPPNAASVPALPSFPMASAVPPQATVTPVSDNAASNSTTDGRDIIGKEWVNMAKQIVEKTRDDPYNQSRELAKLRSEYMQKRYNKTLKLSE